MTKENQKLVKESIEHWERMRDGSDDEAPYAQDCPLCERYLGNRGFRLCTGCPVKEKSGYDLCKCTPYQAAENAWDTFMQNPKSPHVKAFWRKAANAEIRFLRSLLPPKRLRSSSESL